MLYLAFIVLRVLSILSDWISLKATAKDKVGRF